jgi:hypothetical protein
MNQCPLVSETMVWVPETKMLPILLPISATEPTNPLTPYVIPSKKPLPLNGYRMGYQINYHISLTVT